MAGTRVYESARDISVSEIFFYFAYGSNLCRPRLEARIGPSAVIGSAHLQNYRLAFHKNGQDGSAKCNAFYTGSEDDILWGAVYKITLEQKKALDVFEGVGNGYEVKITEAVFQNQTIEIVLYAAQETHIDNDLLPFDWYHAFVLHGAIAHNLPQDHIEQIRATIAQPDLDRLRVAENKRILRNSPLRNDANIGKTG